MKKGWIVYHTAVVLVSIFTASYLGYIAYVGTGNEKATWAIATVSGIFLAVLIFYVGAFIEYGLKKIRSK